MTDLTQKYPNSIAAGRALEGGLWGLALALAKEVEGGGSAPEATKALDEAGVLSTSGEPYSRARVAELVKIGAACHVTPEFAGYPLGRVKVAGQKHQWDAEAMLLTLKAGGTHHDIAGTTFTKVTHDKLLQEADRLSAANRAALATALVSEDEVKEAILRSQPMAREQFIIIGGEIARESVERSERRSKELFPAHAASDAANEISNAANHLNNALAEIIQWGVTLEHDRLRRVESAMQRVERATSEINEALARVESA